MYGNLLTKVVTYLAILKMRNHRDMDGLTNAL